MIKRIWNLRHYFWFFIGMSKINVGLSRASVTSQLRKLDYTLPSSWEFCGLSQNGEDGIIDVLASNIKKPSYMALEIGASNGIENCTSFLCIAKKYQTLMIEGDPKLAKRAKLILDYLQGSHEIVNLLVTPENINILEKYSYMKNLDVFSLDIDSIEFYVLSAFLKMGFRPKIIVVEYNSAFGPDKSITVKYSPDFYKKRSNYKINMHYYGVSVTGYKNLLQRYGYRFVTVESKGINAFFILEKEFDRKFIKNLKPGIDFLENQYTTLSSKTNWKDQFSQISNLEFVKIDKI